MYVPKRLRSLHGGKERLSFYAKKKGDALAKRDAARRDMEEGKLTGRDITFGAYLIRWLDTSEALGLAAERTLHDRRYYSERHLIPPDKLGDVPLGDLTAEDLDMLYARLSAGGMGPRSVNHVHAAARIALQRAVKKRLITYNPARDADPPRYSTDEREYRVFSGDDLKAFLTAAGGDRFEALWTLAVLAGPRPAELRALRWEDLTLPDEGVGAAFVRRTVSEVDGQAPKIRNATKTGKGRSVPLLPACVNALKAHRARQNEERLKLAGLWEDLNLVFPNSGGGIMRRRNLSTRHFKPILTRAGLPPDTRLYDLRHTFATLWIEAGEQIADLSGVLGHSRISTTSDRYVHPSDRARSDAMIRFGERFSKG